jgi:hypothetical protein
MTEATRSAAADLERLTWDEVRRRYPDQWVTLVDIDWVNETDFEFRTALAIGAATRRPDAMNQARSMIDRYPGFACFYTGRIRAPLRFRSP